MSRIDKRVILVLSVALASVAQAGMAGVVYVSRRMREETLRTELEQGVKLAAQVEEAQRNKVTAPPVTPSRWHLMDTADVSGILEVIQARGDAAGVAFSSVNAAQSSTVGKQSFVITGQGTPGQVCTFLANLEGQDRLILVESGKVTPGSDSEVRFELGIATYHLGGPQ